MLGLCTLVSLHPTPVSAQTTESQRQWEVGAFVDFGSLQSLHAPDDHLFRTRGTTPRLDELNVNMAGVYIRRSLADSSRWAVELTAHGGEDSQLFGYSATAPAMAGSTWLRRLGPTNVSYRPSTDRAVIVQAGIFPSFIGYDSLYARDNVAYTRPWAADFTPYLMLGVNTKYAVTDRLEVAGAVVNGYWHLAHANDVPSVGGYASYRLTDAWTIKQGVLYGPHQSDTAPAFARTLVNTMVERRASHLRVAVDLHASTERVAGVANERAWWLAAQVPVELKWAGAWSLTLRPEVAWDSVGRWTTVEQTVLGITTSLSYRPRPSLTRAVLRLEHRADRSTGPSAGFFTRSSAVGSARTATQHLFIVGVMLDTSRLF